MRRFNPEKELKKIQHGKRNKIIFGIMFGIILVTIGYSFALYQVRYSKRIIYTKVAPFNTRDIILSVVVEGESTTRSTFPDQSEGLSYIGLDCEKENTTTGYWDSETWSLNLNTKGPNKCTVLFKKAKLFSEVIVADNTSIFNDDYNNIRYAGADPNNYIWFNCDDYNYLSQTTAQQKCEKWRIIGLFNNITKTSGETENLVKIIRDESIGDIAWTSVGNNWTNASLQKSLNGTYYNGETLSDGKGITTLTRDMIEEVRWDIGAWDSRVSDGSGLTSQYYIKERSSTTYNYQPYDWNGKIALVYPSDYGYATDGSLNGLDRNTCLTTKTLYTYGSSGCRDKDWLFKDISGFTWTLTSDISNANRVYYINDNYVTGSGSAVPGAIFPSLYLKSNVKIARGDGSSNTPYIIIP